MIKPCRSRGATAASASVVAQPTGLPAAVPGNARPDVPAGVWIDDLAGLLGLSGDTLRRDLPDEASAVSDGRPREARERTRDQGEGEGERQTCGQSLGQIRGQTSTRPRRPEHAEASGRGRPAEAVGKHPGEQAGGRASAQAQALAQLRRDGRSAATAAALRGAASAAKPKMR